MSAGRPATTQAPLALRVRREALPEAPAARLQLPLFLELPRQPPPALWWHSCELAPSPEAAMRSQYIARLLLLRGSYQDGPPPLRLGELVAFYRGGRWYWRAPDMPQPELPE